MSEWMKTTLGALVRDRQASLLTGPFGTALKADEYQTHGTPLVSVREIKDGRIVIDNSTPRLGPATLERLPRYLLREGDIVFGRKGAIERSAQISKSQEGYFLGSDGICLRFVGGIHAAFVAYQIRSRRIATWLMANAGGTTMPSMNQTVLDRLPLVLPPLPTQRRIAAVLSALDDKIELNNRINANLEAQAQALFRSWFVDFEPWGGTMPEGWREGKLGDVVECNKESYSTKENWPFVNYLDTGNITRNQIQDIQLMPMAEAPSRARRKVQRLSIVYSTVRPNQCHYGILHEVKENMLVSTGFAVIDANNAISSYRLFLELTQDCVTKHFQTLAEQSVCTYPAINPSDILAHKIVIPPLTVEEQFFAVVSQMFKKMALANQESRSLASLRDTLLPKLMSGEIDVSQVEVPA